MTTFPMLMRPLGYTFRVGRDASLAEDARTVLKAVWDMQTPPDVAELARWYMAAPVWIIGYRWGTPIGCMALYDIREVSFTLDHIQCSPPTHLSLSDCRDLGRLAIVKEERGGTNKVMIGLLREMYAWCERNNITHLLSASSPGLFRIFRRYNRSAQYVQLAQRPVSDAVRAYHAPIIARVGRLSPYTFDLRAFDALDVMIRTLTRQRS